MDGDAIGLVHFAGLLKKEDFGAGGVIAKIHDTTVIEIEAL